MPDRQFHPIDDYLSEDWIEVWTHEGVREVENYLAIHAAFDAYADGSPPTPPA